MYGAKSGVVTRLCVAEPRAVFTHCYGHLLKLACSDDIKRYKLMQDTLDTTHEITKVIKKPPARDVILKQLKEEMQGGVTRQEFVFYSCTLHVQPDGLSGVNL